MLSWSSLFLSSLWSFGYEAAPDLALLCAPGKTLWAFLGTQHPPLCQGYLWEWPLLSLWCLAEACDFG